MEQEDYLLLDLNKDTKAVEDFFSTSKIMLEFSLK